MPRNLVVNPDCPCGSGGTLQACCGPYLSAAVVAPTAEALMRSRYTAYVQRDERYLRASWHKSTRPEPGTIDLSAAAKWVGLEVKHHQSTGPDSAVVEFVARYKVGGRAQRLHEVSRFVREDGRWYYLDALASLD
jgi:SEC-C motif-containing protein